MFMLPTYGIIAFDPRKTQHQISMLMKYYDKSHQFPHQIPKKTPHLILFPAGSLPAAPHLQVEVLPAPSCCPANPSASPGDFHRWRSGGAGVSCFIVKTLSNIFDKFGECMLMLNF